MPDKLSLEKVQVRFPGPEHEAAIVRQVDLETHPGQTMGLVGESGSGKSMTALAILGLVPFPGRIQGSIKLGNRELIGLPDRGYEKIRGAKISIVFQDPSLALNPVFTIEQQLVETLMAHKPVKPDEARERALAGLRQVDIPEPESRMRNYPHQFSGGMKQRILIAMALLCDPDVLILDEPTTALDVTVQAQILDLIERIQSFNKMSIILISHDLGIISEISDEINVMYAGRIVERAKTGDLLARPKHPYTYGLIKAIPLLGAHKAKIPSIEGFPPNAMELPSGCPFHPRCPNRISRCQQQDPPNTSLGNQVFACWNPVQSK